jgi:hypothetical protein
MNDRTIKLLLATVVVLLAAILVRLAFEAPAVRAQGLAAPPAGPGAIAASNNIIYTLQGNQLSAFYLDIGNGNPFEMLKLLGDEKAQEEVRKSAKLKLLVRQDISQLPGAAVKVP